MDDDERDTSDFQDDNAFFDSASCECEHLADDHGWLGCEVEGCPCEARWEE